MKFTKMQGLGNDYLYVASDHIPDNAAELSVKLSDRHFGAGSDGMIWILPSSVADFKMRIFNADGSEAEMCGNGIRCVGKYVFDNGLTDSSELLIETLSGIRKLRLSVDDGKVREVSVDMGTPIVGAPIILSASGDDYRLIPVSVGNPHAVSFCENAEAVPITKTGPVIERSELFPGGVNAEFVTLLGKNRLRRRVWERGSGVTLACGTGAVASAAAAVSLGMCDPDADITVELDGGTLRVRITENGAIMTGPAEFVYEGDVSV